MGDTQIHPGNRMSAFEILQDPDLQSIEAKKGAVMTTTVHQK
jgi:hypothetical protein